MNAQAAKRFDLINFARLGAPPKLPAGLPPVDAVYPPVAVPLTYAAPAGVVDALRAQEAAFNDDLPIADTTVLPPLELYGDVMWKPSDRTLPRLVASRSWLKEEIEPGRFVDVDPVYAIGHTRPHDMNAFAAECHRDNAHWYLDLHTGEKIERNLGEVLMLVVTELAECMEGERKNLMDDHLPHRKMAEVELADAVIRLADTAGARGWNISGPACDPNTVEGNKDGALLRIVNGVLQIRDRSNQGWWAMTTLRQIESYAMKHGYDLWGAVAEKREYNKHRADHKPGSPPAERSAERGRAMKINGTIKNATICTDLEREPARAPCIKGPVFGDTKGRFFDGEKITTSRIESMFALPDGAVLVETRFSTYRVEFAAAPEAAT